MWTLRATRNEHDWTCTMTLARVPTVCQNTAYDNDDDARGRDHETNVRSGQRMPSRLALSKRAGALPVPEGTKNMQKNSKKTEGIRSNSDAVTTVSPVPCDLMFNGPEADGHAEQARLAGIQGRQAPKAGRHP